MQSRSRLRGRPRRGADASLDGTVGQVSGTVSPRRGACGLHSVPDLGNMTSLEAKVVPRGREGGAWLTVLPPQWTTCSPTWG